MKNTDEKTRGYTWNSLWLLVVFSLISSSSYSQAEESEIDFNHTYLTIGAIHSKYQDLKISQTVFSGKGLSGISFKIGTERIRQNYFWDLNFSGLISGVQTRDHEGMGQVINVKLSYSHLRKINDNLFLGGNWDIYENNFARFPDLSNNANNLLFNSTFGIKTRYIKSLNEKWAVNLDFSLGLFGFVRESSSYAYATPQKVLEKGEFNFQNEAANSPFSFKYSSFSYLSQFNKIRARAEFNNKRRVSFFYEWQLLNYRFLKGYPRTNANHTFGVKWKIKSKKK